MFSTFLESGRVIILYGEEYGLIVPGTSFVLARISIDFLGEMHWPGEVEIGTAVSRVGNSSIGLDQALFVDGRLRRHCREHAGAGRQGDPQTAAVFTGARRADQGGGAGGAGAGVIVISGAGFGLCGMPVPSPPRKRESEPGSARRDRRSSRKGASSRLRGRAGRPVP